MATSKEPDTGRAERIATEGCVLRGVVGSTVHGLSNPGTDDRDEMGVCVEPPEYIAGLRPFEHWVSRTQPEGLPSGPGDLDLTIYGLAFVSRTAGRAFLGYVEAQRRGLLGDRHATRTRELSAEYGYDTKYAIARAAHRPSRS